MTSAILTKCWVAMSELHFIIIQLVPWILSVSMHTQMWIDWLRRGVKLPWCQYGCRQQGNIFLKNFCLIHLTYIWCSLLQGFFQAMFRGTFTFHLLSYYIKIWCRVHQLVILVCVKKQPCPFNNHYVISIDLIIICWTDVNKQHPCSLLN